MHALGDSHWYKVMNKSTGGTTSTAMKNPKDVKEEIEKQVNDAAESTARNEATVDGNIIQANFQEALVVDKPGLKSAIDEAKKFGSLEDAAESIGKVIPEYKDDVIAYLKWFIEGGKKTYQEAIELASKAVK